MQRKIAILGGVGLIGSHLIERLIETPCEIYCVDVREPSASPLLRNLDPERFHYVRHNITSPFTIRCDEIYNLCTPTRVNYDKQLPVESLKTHLLGGFNTLENARTEFAKVLYASSSRIYTPSPRFEPEPCHERRIIAEGIRGSEMIHQAYFQEYGVDCRIARLFNCYGSGADLNDRRVVMRMVSNALLNRPITIFGSGEQLRTFCWAGDIAEGLIALMQAPPAHQPRIVDLGGDQEVTIRTLAEKIIELTGSHSAIHHVEARHGDQRACRPDLTTAANELHWRPKTSLVEGLKRLIEYVEREFSAYSSSTRTWVEIYG